MYLYFYYSIFNYYYFGNNSVKISFENSTILKGTPALLANDNNIRSIFLLYIIRVSVFIIILSPLFKLNSLLNIGFKYFIFKFPSDSKFSW